MFEISDFFDVSALSTVLEERLMSIHDVQLAINALRIVKPRLTILSALEQSRLL